MSASPLQDFQKNLAASWFDSNDLRHQQATLGQATGSLCTSAPSAMRSSSSPPKTQRLGTSCSRNNRSMTAPRAKRAPASVDVRKPILIVDPPLFPTEDFQDVHNCRQMPAQVLTVNAHVKREENNTPVRPPPTPLPQRLPTPDLPELENDIFCDCCTTQRSAIKSTKEVMVSREKAGRKRETMYFGMK
jgi:hypothetical protein